MGIGGSKTPVQWTNDLWKQIDTGYYDHYTINQVKEILEHGALITTPNQRGAYMYSTVVQKRNLNASAKKQDQVGLCDQLIKILSEHASTVLSKLLVDENGQNMNDIRLLITVLGANCYQEEKYGSLGLLGEILKKKTVTRESVELLIKTDQRARLGLGKQNKDGQTCMDLAKTMNKTDIIDYIQLQLNRLLNKMPFERDISIEEIRSWIINGANTEWTDENGETVLCKAVDANKLELCEALVAAGANTSCQNKNQQTLVQIARSKTPVNHQLIRILESRALIDVLIAAIVKRRSIDDIRAIVNQGADINRITNAHKDTFLHLLILNQGSADIVKMFIDDYKADINAMNVKNHRAIETAIVCDSDDQTTCSILKVFFGLKQFTTDLFYNGKLGQSILTFADNQKQKQQVRKLIQIELNQRLYKLCQSPTDNTESNDNDKDLLDEITKLVKYGAQIDHHQSSDNYGKWTIVHLLCQLGKLNLLKYVIETLKATSYDEKTEPSGDHPISIAAEHGHLTIVQYFRETFDQMNFNIANTNGDTPLHKAAKNNHFLVVRYLVQWGADPQAKNKAQQKPLALIIPSDTNKPLIQFLDQFAHIPNEQSEQTRPRSAHRLDDDFDFCRLVVPVILDGIQPNFETSPESNRSASLLEESPNKALFEAAKNGDLFKARNAIANHADVRYLNNRRSSYAIAVAELRKNQNEHVRATTFQDKQLYAAKSNQYDLIVKYLSDIATTEMKKAIQQGNAGLTIAYHQCGAIITLDLLKFACENARDSKEIVDYLITNDQQTNAAMFNFNPASQSPYSIALKNKYTNIANYIQWKLTQLLTNAVNQNDVESVRKLLRAGASADMDGHKNLDQAIQKNNIDMVQALCEHGARFPSSSNTTNPQIKSILKRYERNHKLRKAAANGKLPDVIHCHRQCADINAQNCHGATALLLTILSGENYPIVYYLVSCGASMIHFDVTQSSVLHLATVRKYQQIHDYLSKQLNTQFLSTIIDDDTSKTEALAALGTDFNCTDDEGRTPLHYAVQYHGIELVKWLCDRGSNPMKADNNGNYPITQAAKKGDYAVIKYFIDEHGPTRQLKNKQGLDVLAIAKKERFNEIVQLLDPGSVPFLPRKKASKPKYTNERLDRAVKHSEIQIIQEFIDQVYESLKEKTEQCARMIEIAKQEKQYQVLSMLQPHYAELSKDFASDQAAGRLVNLGQTQLTVFYGFMNSLSDLITGNHTTLDPSNPQTYRDLFTNMFSQGEKRSAIIKSINTSQDSQQFCEQELTDTQDKIGSLNKSTNDMKVEQQKLIEQVHQCEKQLNNDNVSVIDKKQYFKDKQTMEDALNALEASIQLSQHAHETALNKKKLLDYIKGELRLFVFYTTIEHRLQSLFNGVLAAQSDLLQTELTTRGAKIGSAIIENFPLESIPIASALLGPIKNATNMLLKTIDKRRQKAEWYNISVLGNIEELQKAASTTAGLLTLYYSQQIKLIHMSLSKVRGSNILSTTVANVNTFIEGTPEPEDERTLVLVAEFICGFIIETLKLQDRKETKDGKKSNNSIDKNQPLAEQLWLFVAKENFLEIKGLDAVKATTGVGLAKRIIVIQQKIDGIHLQVQIRHLFGYVSLITGDGTIYRVKNETKVKSPFDDIEGIFGYVYLDPFIANDKVIIDKICEGRNLDKSLDVDQSKVALIDAKENITQGVQSLKEVSTANGNNAGITKRMALSVGQVLQDEKIFLTKDDIDNRLHKHQTNISYDVGILRDEIKSSTNKFQTSIDAAYDKIGKDFDDCTQKLQRDNQDQYQKGVQKISSHQKELEERLERSNAANLSKIDNDLKKKSDAMMTIANNAKKESEAAVQTSRTAEELSMKCEQKAKKASDNCDALVASTDKRKQEMQQTIDECTSKLRQTIEEQKQAYQTSLNELQNQMKADLETLRTAATDASRRAKEAEEAAKNTAQQMKQLRENQVREMDQLKKRQKEETDRLIKTEADKIQQLINDQEKERKKTANFTDQIKSEVKNVANDAKRLAEVNEKMLKKIDK